MGGGRGSPGKEVACVVGRREEKMEGLVSPADAKKRVLCSLTEHILYWARQVQVQYEAAAKAPQCFRWSMSRKKTDLVSSICGSTTMSGTTALCPWLFS